LLKIWIPLWILIAISIVWFLLLQFEVLESGPPMWIGWVTIVAAAIWCVLATFQLRLTGIVKESVVPHRQDERDGVLAVRRLVDLLRAFALLGGRASSSAGCCRST
jgi:hypothetical protein